MPFKQNSSFTASHNHLRLFANRRCNSGIIVPLSNNSSESVNQSPPFFKAKIALVVPFSQGLFPSFLKYLTKDSEQGLASEYKKRTGNIPSPFSF